MQNIHSVVDSFFLLPIIETEVTHLLRNLDSFKSTGLHHIPIKYLKMTTTVAAPILTDMYNCCTQEGVYPDVLKIVQIIPVYKKGNKSSCTNYRPISLLSPINKIFEKLIYNQLKNYLTKKKLLTDNQYGFRTGYSTSLAVPNICDEIINNLENNEITCAIFLDLAKAFDTVNHAVLLEKLHT